MYENYVCLLAGGREKKGGKGRDREKEELRQVVSPIYVIKTSVGRTDPS